MISGSRSLVSKTQQAISLFNAGDLKGCLRIISTWRASRVVSVEELAVFNRGYGCLVHPSSYRQMGKDPEACVAAAKALFQSKFIKEKSQ